VPVELLSDKHAAGCGRLRGVLSRGYLERFVYLDDVNQDSIADRLGDS